MPKTNLIHTIVGHAICKSLTLESNAVEEDKFSKLIGSLAVYHNIHLKYADTFIYDDSKFDKIGSILELNTLLDEYYQFILSVTTPEKKVRHNG
jgi:hypothetical protein